MDRSSELTGFARWGNYSDLYDTLSAKEVQSLEHAIRARRLGRFHECRRVFDEELPPSHILPILAIEKAHLEARLGLERTRLETLSKALESQSEWRTKSSGNVIKLLSILRAEAKVKAEGTLKQVLMQARSLRDDFENVKFENWTDVEFNVLMYLKFGFAETYYRIMRDCKRWSNWLDQEGDMKFPTTRVVGESHGIDTMKKCLLRSNRLRFCSGFVSSVGELMDNDTKLDFYYEFISVLESGLHIKSDVLAVILLDCRLDFADFLCELGMTNPAKEQLEKTNMELEQMSWIAGSDQQRQVLNMLQVGMPSSLKMDDLPERLELARLARESGDRLLETRLLARIMLTLNQVQQIDRGPQWMSISDANQKRYSELHSEYNGNVLLTAGNLCFLANSVGFSTSKGADYLYQLANFHLKYPEFDIPKQCQSIFRGAERSSRNLGRLGDAAAYELKKSSAIRDSPWDPSDFFKSYRDKPHDDWAPYLIEIVLSWVQSELESNTIPPKEVTDLLLLTHFSEDKIEERMRSSFLLQELQKVSIHALVKALYGDPIPVKAEKWESCFQHLENWLVDRPMNVETWIRHTVLGDIQESRCTSIRKYLVDISNSHNQAMDENLQLEARQLKLLEDTRLLGLRKTLDSSAMGSNPENIHELESNVMSNKFNLTTSFKAVRSGIVKDSDVLEVQKWKENTFLGLQKHQVVNRLVALTNIALCMKQRYILWGTVPPDACLDTLQKYDDIYKEQRLERSILRASENMRVRAEVVSLGASHDHYSFAMGMCVEALGRGQLRRNYHRHIHQEMTYNATLPAAIRKSQSLFVELIDWAQKKKARAMTEIIGAEIIIPKKTLLSLENDAHAQEMIQRERDLQEEFERAAGDLIGMTEALQNLRSQMRNYPGLKQIMDMRDGLALTESQIQALGRGLGPNVLIVDYIYLATAYTGILNEILPMVYKNGQLCNAFFVGPKLNYKTLERWTKTVMEEQKPLSTEDGAAALSMLYPLVETAVRFSEPGDTILFCPTGVLFGIPLHAIDVAGKPLIARNPIVYTQSLSVFKICELSASALDSSSSLDPVAFYALSDEDAALPGAASMSFAKRIGAPLLKGLDLTKESLLTAMTDSSLIHFYGHVLFDKTEPLDHCLAIRGLPSENVTARDIFNMRLRSGAHVSLIGCQSGQSKIGVNDDLLGLSTALFYAGAGSIVSALWSIDMSDGSAFQEAFYDHLLRQGVELSSSLQPESAVLDMAKAFQQAVLEISVDENGARKAPYHWAAFTFQGCWNKFPAINPHNDGIRSKGVTVEPQTAGLNNSNDRQDEIEDKPTHRIVPAAFGIETKAKHGHSSATGRCISSCLIT